MRNDAAARTFPAMTDWEAIAKRAGERWRDGSGRVLEIMDQLQRQHTRTANAAWAQGLALTMLGRDEEAREGFVYAAHHYYESWLFAPPASWGRPIAIMKSWLLAGAPGAAAEVAAEVLRPRDEDETASPTATYARCLALLVTGRDGEAREAAATLQGAADFPDDVADALAALAAHDRDAYARAVREVLRSFEEREEFLEDVPVADTVLVLQALAAPRGIAVELPDSRVLP